MPNHLAKETSPYLLQHADNPVDWYPWCEEALLKSRTEDKPILLSIGYSACHWCHVMAHETFENPDIAAIMNDNFINIKVDREERPDLDSIYMQAVQAITGSGGWPLTVFLTPEREPFFGGTYFPPEDRQGFPGFPRVLHTVAEAYKNRRHDIQEAANQDIIIMAAAVADFKPETFFDHKIKKTGKLSSINLLKTKDILKEIGNEKGDKILVGFAVETENELENAKRKLVEKNLDLIVMNNRG